MVLSVVGFRIRSKVKGGGEIAGVLALRRGRRRGETAGEGDEDRMYSGLCFVKGGLRARGELGLSS